MDKKVNEAAMRQMRTMDVGEFLEFPLNRLNSIRSMACVVGTENGKRLCTRVDRDNNIVVVTRTF